MALASIPISRRRYAECAAGRALADCVQAMHERTQRQTSHCHRSSRSAPLHPLSRLRSVRRGEQHPHTHNLALGVGIFPATETRRLFPRSRSSSTAEPWSALHRGTAHLIERLVRAASNGWHRLYGQGCRRSESCRSDAHFENCAVDGRRASSVVATAWVNEDARIRIRGRLWLIR